MKKRIIVFLLAVFTSVSLFSFDANLMSRYFELGVSSSIMGGNNVIPFTDIFTQHAIIDLPKISDETTDKGLTITTVLGVPNIFMNLHLKKMDVHFRSNLGVETTFSMTIDKELIDVLGKGNQGTDSFDFKLGSQFDIFAYYNFEAQFKIKKLAITLSPSAFVPILHIEPKELNNLHVENTMNGTFKFDGDYTLHAYSRFNIEQVKKMIDSGNFDFASIDPAEILKGVGFDLGGTIGYEILPSLQVGGYARIPVVPGRLNMRTIVGGKVDGEYGIGGQNQQPTFLDPDSFTTSPASFQIFRPLRFGGNLVFKPFERWLTLNVSGGAGAKALYGKTQWYAEYSIGVSTNVYNILRVSVVTQYLQEIFMHELGIALNARVLEVQGAIAASSPDFKKSFQGTGDRKSVV